MIIEKWTAPMPHNAREVRKEVFIDEQGFSAADEFDQIDQTALHIVLYEDGLPIATGRIIDGGQGVFHLGRIAIKKQYRGRGLGRSLIARMEAKSVLLGAQKTVLSAQLQAKAFYEKCGYTAHGKEYMDGHVRHILMTKGVDTK